MILAMNNNNNNNNNNNPSKVHPQSPYIQADSSGGAAIATGQLGNTTGGVLNLNLSININTKKATPIKIPTLSHPLAIPRNQSTTIQQISPTATSMGNKTIISRFNSIELLKKQVLRDIDSITDSRLVEILGGLAAISVKQLALTSVGNIWTNLLNGIDALEINITALSHEPDSVYRQNQRTNTNTNMNNNASNNQNSNQDPDTSQQMVSEFLLSLVKEIETKYLDLVCTSSIRFLDTVCTVHDLQYKHIIHIRYDIRQWRKSLEIQIREMKQITENRQEGNMSQKLGNNATGTRTKGRSISLFAKICGSCAPNVKTAPNKNQS